MLFVRDFFDLFRHAIGEVEAIRGVSTYPPGIRCHGGPCAGELSQDVDRDRTIVIGSQPRISSAAQFGPPFVYVNSGRIALSWDRIELNRGNAGRWSHPAPPGDCAGPSASRARTHPTGPALGTTHVPTNGPVSEGLQIMTNSRVSSPCCQPPLIQSLGRDGLVIRSARASHACVRCATESGSLLSSD